MASRVEWARRIWPIPAEAASRRQLITYGDLGKIVGTIARGIGRYLKPIEEYWLRNQLPPLTVIVVRADTR